MRLLFALSAGGILLAVSGLACAEDDLLTKAKALFQPIPEKVAEVSGKKIDEKQVALGHKLFFDPRLSKSHVFSCNSCHNVGTGGADNLPFSCGHGWENGARNSPTVFNAVFNVAQFWDGRAADLATQARGPIENPVEMGNTAENAVRTLKSIPQYVEEFKESFPKEKDSITLDTITQAIGAYETRLITPDAPFDKYLRGDQNALTVRQKEGLKTFMDANCVMCHNGINVGGQAYFPFGLRKKPEADLLPAGDEGRFEVTKTDTDEYVFRAAPLRNVALTAPYFHSGQVWNLQQTVSIMGDTQLAKTLTDKESAAIVEFLGSLTGRQPEVEYPILPPSTKDTPNPIFD